MSKTALITGIAGQDGAYLADFLLSKGYKVIGLTRSIEKQKIWRLEYLKIRKRVEIISGSITDGELIKNTLCKYQPQEMYNLASQSSVAKSWEQPEETWFVNSVAMVRLLENIRVHAPSTRLFHASTAEIYGNSSKEITEETNSFSPLNPYASSKLAAHFLIKNYRHQYGLFLSNGVLFTHTSPLQIDSTVAKNIARNVAKISLGQADKITLGDISIERDFSFAGDTVRAMWQIVQEEKPRDFIISSGKTRSIEELVKEAFAYIGVKEWQPYVMQNPALVRKQDIRKMAGSSQALKKIGWQPAVTFEALVQMMVDYERNVLQHGDT